MRSQLSVLEPFDGVIVALRRRLARRRRWWWVPVGVFAAIAAWGVHDARQAAEAARAAWGTNVEVVVAVADAGPGEPIVADVRQIPAALAPDRAVDPAQFSGDRPAIDGATPVARQALTAGEIVVEPDLSAAGAMARVPAGWRAVTVIEHRRSGVDIGDRVDVIADGLVLTTEGIVVDRHADDDLVTIAVPTDSAAIVATADLLQQVALARHP